MGRIERGEVNITLERLYELANALNIPVYELDMAPYYFPQDKDGDPLPNESDIANKFSVKELKAFWMENTIDYDCHSFENMNEKDKNTFTKEALNTLLEKSEIISKCIQLRRHLVENTKYELVCQVVHNDTFTETEFTLSGKYDPDAVLNTGTYSISVMDPVSQIWYQVNNDEVKDLYKAETEQVNDDEANDLYKAKDFNRKNQISSELSPRAFAYKEIISNIISVFPTYILIYRKKRTF